MMKTFHQFLTESNDNPLTDYRKAVELAKRDGFVTNTDSFNHHIPLDKVPAGAQKGPNVFWHYVHGGAHEQSHITMYEPTKKKGDFSKDGKNYAMVDRWYLSTQDDLDAKQAEKDAEAAEKQHYKDHIKPAQIAWIKQVFDAAQEKIKHGHHITYTTMTHQFEASKPEHLKFVPGQGMMALRRYASSSKAAKYEWIAMDQIRQIAHQVGVPISK